MATYHQYIAKLAQLQKPDQLTTAAESPAQLNSIMQVNGTDETEEIPMETLQNEKDEEKSDEVRKWEHFGFALVLNKLLNILIFFFLYYKDIQ